MFKAQSLSMPMPMPMVMAFGFVFGIGFAGCGDGSSDDGSCQAGSRFCACFNGTCMVGLTCINNLCIGDGSNPETSGSSGDGDGDSGDGDGDGTPGDGDGSPGDGDGGPGDGDGGPGDGDGDGELCEFPLAYTPGNVMFVLDASAGMAVNTVDHDVNANTPPITRWNMVITGLQAVLPGYQSLIRAGIKRFPSSTAMSGYVAESCTTTNTLEASVALDNSATILAAVPPANVAMLVGASPTSRGFAAAATHLSNQSATLPRAVVLIADSIGACSPNEVMPGLIENIDTTLVPAVEDALQFEDITTYAFGIQLPNQIVGGGLDGSPEGNPFVWLNDIAIAGGAPLSGSTKFRDSSTLAGLTSGLTSVLDTLVCTLDLNSLPGGAPTPAQIPNVGFELNGAVIPMVGSCSASAGWTWLIEGERIQFCGSYCSQYKSSVAGFVGGYCG